MTRRHHQVACFFAILVWLATLNGKPLCGQTIPQSEEQLPETGNAESNSLLEGLVPPEDIFADDAEVTLTHALQPRPLLVPQTEVTPQVELPGPAASRFALTVPSRPGSPLTVSLGGRRASSNTVPGSEARARSTTDSGSLLDRSPMILGVGAQRRTPIVTDPRIRGSRVGTLAASGSYWVPARMDLDTMLSKIDSRIVSDITVVKGPYTSLYGPGSSFIDVDLLPAPRFDQPEIHGSTSGDYKSNGQQWYGRQTIWGGDDRLGFRVGYGNKGGGTYQSGDGTDIAAGYHSQDFDVAFGYDIDDNSKLEFHYLRLDQTDVLFPGQAFDMNYLVTDAFEVGYEILDTNFADRVSIDAWYNRTRFQGDNFRPSKRQEFPFYDFLTFNAKTNVDAMSTGARMVSNWYHTDTESTTAGLDFREIRQGLNEIGTAPLLGVTQPSNSPIPRSSSANPGLFVEHVVQPLEPLTVTLGGRVDLIDAELNANGSEIAALGLSNPQAPLSNLLGTSEFDRTFALVSFFATSQYEVDDNWTIQLAAGSGQRAPNLTEMYAAGPFMFLLQNGLNTVTGDPRLKPERTWQFDVGTSYTDEKTNLGLTGFYAFMQNYITFENVGVVGGPPLGEPQQVNLQFVNTDLATLAGFEAHAQYDLAPWLTPFSTLNYVQGTDQTRDGNFATQAGNSAMVKTRDPNHVRGYYSGVTGNSSEPLPQILPLQARLGFRLHEPSDRPRWNVEIAARAVDRQRRVAASLLEQPTPGFTVWDLRGTWQATDKLLLVSGVENFTNRNYQEHLDYRPQSGGGTFRVWQPGVNFYFGTEVQY